MLRKCCRNLGENVESYPSFAPPESSSSVSANRRADGIPGNHQQEAARYSAGNLRELRTKGINCTRALQNEMPAHPGDKRLHYREPRYDRRLRVQEVLSGIAKGS